MPRSPRRQLPFLVLAPATVLVLGLAAAFAIAAFGVRQLRQQSDSAAALRSRLVGSSLAERLRATPKESHVAEIERAARRSGADLLLVNQHGQIRVDATLGPPPRTTIRDLLLNRAGETLTRLGRTQYFTAPVSSAGGESRTLITFFRAPEIPYATASLINSVALFTLLLVGVATLVAYTLARDVESDLTFIRERIVKMARRDQGPRGEPIPVRSVDQIGVLTTAFNMLLDRFAAAEHAYRQDLAGAHAYDRDRSAFLAALSHELRTPLNAILGFTEVLLSEVDGPLSADASESMGVVRASGQHLRSLIGDILDLSALESRELKLNSQHIDIYAIAEEVTREAKVTADSKHLTMELSGLPATAWADPIRVRQIIGNLVGNAVKFTSRGGVAVHVEQRERIAAVVISDTGPGIAEEEREAIFEEYTQSGEISARRTGTGLGLAITRRLVQMHGGTIHVESRLGMGSRFSVFLPLEARRPLRSKRADLSSEPLLTNEEPA